jgi:hypothetical protein
MRLKQTQKTHGFTVRLSETEAAEFQEHRERLELGSNSEVVSYLLAKAKANKDGFEDMIYTLVDRLADHVERRFQSLNTMQQLNLALNDAFMKYVVSTLPHVPDELKDTARLRGMDIYKNINIVAVQEFQRRRRTDAYGDASLGIEEEGTPA